MKTKYTNGGTCPRCGSENDIVNECKCDKNNLPTKTTKHTPGPWKVERTDGGHPNLTYRPYLVRGETGYCALINFGGSWPDNVRANANAALIAAAPSMETALEMIRELMKNAPHVVTTDPDFYDWHERMWKARCLAENVLLTAHGMSQNGVTPIAKAEGRTP